MRVECQRTEDVWDALAEPWRALHERSATATIFNSEVYAACWWQHFGTSGALQVWTVWDEAVLVGVAPLYETVDEQGAPVLRFVGGVEVSDYLDVLTEPGREEVVLVALLAGWADAPCCCPLDLHALPHASPTREAFLRLASALGFQATAEREAVCPVITLPDSWEAYLEQVDGKQRRELRRKLRKAGQEGLVSWYQVSLEEVREEMETFFHLHTLSSPEKAAFMTPPMRAFFTDLALALSARGWLDLCILLVNGRPAAASMGFRFRDAALLYNSGFDSALTDSLSPGWLLLSYHIEATIAAGYRRYDFMRGDEEYKFRFGARSEPIYHLRLARSLQTAGA